MEIICRYCQGIIVVDYKIVYKVDEDYFVTYCIGCGAENEVWDVYDWFSPEEIDHIEKHNSEREHNGTDNY